VDGRAAGVLAAFEEMVPFVTTLVSLEEDPAVRVSSTHRRLWPAFAADLPVEAVFGAAVPDRARPGCAGSDVRPTRRAGAM
jgi:hypothetical protein